MSGERLTIDTNILIYSLDNTEKTKQSKSIKVIEQAVTADCVLTLQALCEFYSAVTRKNKITSEEALTQIRDWQILFPVVSAEPSTLQRAIRAVQEHQLSFWDAMLWTTARDAGVDTILSEDFNSNSTIGRITFINPLKSKI